MKLSGLYLFLFFASTIFISCSNDAGDKDDNTNTGTSQSPNTETATAAPSVAKEKIPDAATQGLKGKVEVLSESIYSADASRKNLSYKNVFKYNTNGNTTELANYSSDGKLKSTIKSSYDANGYLADEQTIMSDGTIELTSTIKVDAKGNRIEQNDVRQNSSTTLFNYKHFFKYDEKGQMVERIVLRGNGTFLYKYNFSYDANGNKTEWIQYGSETSITGKVYFKFDDKNKMIEETQYGMKGELISTFTYSYEFDKKGNWIRRNKMQEGELIEIKERQITYD